MRWPSRRATIRGDVRPGKTQSNYTASFSTLLLENAAARMDQRRGGSRPAASPSATGHKDRFRKQKTCKRTGHWLGSAIASERVAKPRRDAPDLLGGFAGYFAGFSKASTG
jgi:hypothetical protein